MSRQLNALCLCLVGCGESLSPQQQAQQFCTALDSVNGGGVDTRGLTELEGHALVLKTLLDVAPTTIAKDRARFHSAFANWAAAVSGDQPMLDTFMELSEPSLAGAEGRIADYIARHCELRLGDGGYKEAARPSAQGICPGWPRIGSPNTFNNFPNLPDISGANYFAYHPNDMDLNNLRTLRDEDLEPDPGSVNPFREIPTPNGNNYYTARLVFGPQADPPATNTSYVGEKKIGGNNRYVINMLRLYASDLGDGANSGGVPLPAVTIYDADGEITDHFEECDLYALGGESIRTALQFPKLPIADHRARATPQWSTSSNFDAASDTMANADVQYLSTVYSRRFGDIFVVRAKYLSAPSTRAGTPVSVSGYDIGRTRGWLKLPQHW